ncbi:MAG: Fur family transcriptional regulator [Lachnospiraceae bacterium]|nr:Fur family transcriptional regulator [Lachnospiraceae bacterium]MDY5743008.1 Fur family transcriptional regulator [Lachnospiraceae bacterium]
MSQQTTKLVQALQEKGMRVTKQRINILDSFMTLRDCHVSVEELHQAVIRRHPEIGLATVYRTVQLLEELGFVDSIHLDDGVLRYELCDHEPDESKHRHHHLLCQKCGKVMSFEADLLENLEAKIRQELGFEVCDHEVKLYGYCKECRDNGTH